MTAGGRPRITGGVATRSFAWAALSLCSNRVVVLAITLILARLLAPSDFGTFAAAMAVIAYLEVGLDLGVSAALIYEQEDKVSDRVHTAFTITVIACLALALVNFALAPMTASYFGVAEDVDVFRALSLFIVIRGAGQVGDALLKRDLRFKQKTVVDVMRAVVRGAIAIPLAVAGSGPWALVIALVASEAVGVGANWKVTGFRPRLVFDGTAARSLIRYGAPIAGLKLLGEAGRNADYLVVGGALGATALGYYTMGYRLPELIIDNLLWVFSGVAFPVFSRARAEGVERLRGAMLRSLTLVTMFGFSAGVALALLARDAIWVLFSGAWEPSTGTMVLLALGLGISSLEYASGEVFPAMGRPGTLLRLEVVVTAVRIVGFIVAAPHGITWVAAVHLVVAAPYGGLRMLLANRLLDVTWKETVTALRSAVIVASCVAAIGGVGFAVSSRGLSGLLVVATACAVGAVLGAAVAGPTCWDVLRGVSTALFPRRPSAAGGQP